MRITADIAPSLEVDGAAAISLAMAVNILCQLGLDQRLIRDIPFVGLYPDPFQLPNRQTQDIVLVEGFRLGKRAGLASLQST